MDEQIRRTEVPRLLPTPPSLQSRSTRRDIVLLLLAILVIAQLLSHLGHPSAAGRPHSALSTTGDSILWLGSPGPYSVAFDLGSQRWLPVPTRFPFDTGGYRFLSPDGELLAAWTPDAPREPSQVTILTREGTILARWRWNGLTVRRPLGWLDPRTLLVRETPLRLPYEREAEYLARLERSSALLAIDVRTGEERILLRRPITDVFPGPDGHSLAVALPLEPFGAGATNWTLILLDLRTPDRQQAIDRVILHDAFPPRWLPDGSGLIVARRTEAAAMTLPTSVELVLARRDGTTTTVMPRQPNLDVRPLAVSPNGQELFVLAVPLGQFSRARLGRVTLSSLTVQWIADLDRLAGPIAVIPASERTLLLVVRQITDPPRSNGVEITELFLIQQTTLTFLGTIPGRWGFDAWGSPLATVRSSPPEGSREGAVRPATIGKGPLLVAPGFRWLLAPSPAGGIALWDLANGIPLTDLWAFEAASWHPAGMGAIALGIDHRLYLVTRSLDGIWIREPLEPDDQTQHEDLAIAIGPDGRLAGLSRSAGNRIALWVGTPPTRHPLRTWAASDLPGLPCVAWRAPGQLLVGYPAYDGSLLLGELTLDEQGSEAAEQRVVRLRPWRDRLVESCQAVISSDGARLALRLRSGDHETLVLLALTTTDPPLYVASGKAAGGLAWSPDGTQLAFGLGDRLVVTSASGHLLTERITGDPVVAVAWPGNASLWALVDRGNHAELVTIDAPPSRSASRSRDGQRSRRSAGRAG